MAAQDPRVATPGILVEAVEIGDEPGPQGVAEGRVAVLAEVADAPMAVTVGAGSTGEAAARDLREALCSTPEEQGGMVGPERPGGVAERSRAPYRRRRSSPTHEGQGHRLLLLRGEDHAVLDCSTADQPLLGAQPIPEEILVGKVAGL